MRADKVCQVFQGNNLWVFQWRYKNRKQKSVVEQWGHFAAKSALKVINTKENIYLSKNICTFVQVIDEYSMEEWVTLDKEKVIMGFAASCVEHVARQCKVPYNKVYDALKRVDAFRKYIIPHYDVLHTQSRQYVNDDIIEYLKNHGETL